MTGVVNLLEYLRATTDDEDTRLAERLALVERLLASNTLRM